MCVWLLVSALLILAALLIPDFGDVKSLLHLLCQLSSHYPQPSGHFRLEFHISTVCLGHTNCTVKHPHEKQEPTELSHFDAA